METILGQIEKELIDALNPLLVPLGLGSPSLKQIEVEAFSTGEDIAELLDNLRSRMPGAYLNIPGITYNASQDVRAADFVLDYAFLVGVDSTGRMRLEDKKNLLYYFHESFHREFFYRRIQNCDIPANLDFIRPGRFEVATADKIMVSLTTFSLAVRNWQIRQPTR